VCCTDVQSTRGDCCGEPRSASISSTAYTASAVCAEIDIWGHISSSSAWGLPQHCIRQRTSSTRRPKPIGKAVRRLCQEPPHTSGSIDKPRNDVGALGPVISCDAGRCACCEKYARAYGIDAPAAPLASTADLTLPSPMVLLRSREAVCSTAPLWVRCTRARCGLVAHAEQSRCWHLLRATGCNFVTLMVEALGSPPSSNRIQSIDAVFNSHCAVAPSCRTDASRRTDTP
jgi:hypothetical protein